MAYAFPAVTRAERAAADLHARIAEWPGLDGVAADVESLSGRSLRVTVNRLPPGAVAFGPHGLEATVEGARITDLLHHLARQACARAGVTRPTEFRVRPAALAAAVLPTPARKAS